MEILSINWSNAFVVFGLGAGIVFIVLVLLIFLLNGFGLLFTKKKNPKTETLAITTKGCTGDVDAIAIAAALHLFDQDMHDIESCIITIIDKKTSWNSKIWGLNKFSR